MEEYRDELAKKRLGFGCLRLPLKREDDPTSVDVDQFTQMVDAFLARGFSYFDTGYTYHDGKSEELLREVLVKRYPRSSFQIADKVPTFMLKQEGQQERILEDQIKRCGVDFFDCYLLHSLGGYYYPAVQRLKTFEFVADMKRQGMAKKIGFSFHGDAALLEQILQEHPEMDFVQLQLNYLDWNSDSLQAGKCYEVARRFRKPIIVMEPVKGGTLAKLPPQAQKLFRQVNPEASDASWAMRFVAQQETALILSGVSSLQQLQENMDLMDDPQPLTEQEQEAVSQVTEVLNGITSIPCTACRYCEPGCPMQIPIPRYFSLYNTDRQSVNQGFSMQIHYYLNMKARGAKPSDCIQCGQCETVCPQHLKIPELLKKVDENFIQYLPSSAKK